MGTKPIYRPHPFGGIHSTRPDGTQIIIRPAHDGGTRVVIYRPTESGIHALTHQRRFPGVRL